MKGRYLAVVAVAAGITACASNSDVRKIGKDTYSIAARQPETGGAAETRRRVLSDAESYCASLEKSFVFLRAFTPISYFSDKETTNYVLDFRCLDQSSPEYKDTVIGKTPDINQGADIQ